MSEHSDRSAWHPGDPDATGDPEAMSDPEAFDASGEPDIFDSSGHGHGDGGPSSDYQGFSDGSDTPEGAPLLIPVNRGNSDAAPPYAPSAQPSQSEQPSQSGQPVRPPVDPSEAPTMLVPAPPRPDITQSAAASTYGAYDQGVAGAAGATDATVLVPADHQPTALAGPTDLPYGTDATERPDDVEHSDMAYQGGYGPPGGHRTGGRQFGRSSSTGEPRRRPTGKPPWHTGRSSERSSGPGGSGGSRLPVRRRWIVLGIVLLLIAYPLGLFWTAWNHLDTVDAMPDGDRPKGTPGTTYLVVGSDSREDLDSDSRRKLGTGKVAGRRTDTIMLLHVPDGGGPNVLLSLPRDSYVPIPGHDRNKINSAYAFGGPQLLVQTVEQTSGLRIDGYVETGLMGYADLVDAVGGIEVCSKRAMKDTKAHLDIPAGCQQFDGATALGYSRARYSDPRGDLGRVERQRQVLSSIASRTFSPSVILVPWRSFPAAAAGGDALRVNDGASPWDLLGFISAMRGVAGGKGLSLTVPISNPDLSTPAGSAVQWDREGALSVFNKLKQDDTEALRPLAEKQKKATG